MPVVRGCGTRVAGGIYLSVATSPYGKPLEDFLVDPPIPIHPGEIGVTPVGVRGVEDAAGIYHVFDWVGSEHYPHVSDAIEEGRHYGFSRRAEGSGIDYARITARSSLVLIHARAAFGNPNEFAEALVRDRLAPWQCPVSDSYSYSQKTEKSRAIVDRHCGIFARRLGRPDEPIPELRETCLGLHYHDFASTEVVREFDDSLATRQFPPKNPQFEYGAHVRPEGFKPVYQIAIFAQLPLGSVEIVRDPADPARESAQFEKAKVAKIDVRLVDE